MARPHKYKKEEHMTDHSESDQADSAVDAKAILALILIVVATAVFWVSQQ